MARYWWNLFICQRSSRIKVSVINEREKVGIKNLKNPKTFIDYSQAIDDVYENLEDYDPTKKRRVSILFDDMVADMKSNKDLKLFHS